jgi:P2-related tail formation protein
MPVIQDQASNAFQTQTVTMLGFIEPEAQADVLQSRIYMFLLDSIRTEDLNRGDLFLKRFLEGENGDSGPQAIWNTQHTTIRAMPGLWNVNDVSDEFLPFLRRIVGWTPEIEDIPLALSGNALRRLIATSVAFWKRRGPDDAMLDLINEATDGARVRILDWFDYRVIADEAEMGYTVQGLDIHMITESDENRYNVRIVDDGTLNKVLMKRVVALTRPINERVDISYLGFLDMFQVDGDIDQWGGDTADFAVASGLATLADAAGPVQVHTSSPAAAVWANYTFTFVAKWDTGAGSKVGAGAVFYRTGAGDYYNAVIDSDIAGATYNHLILQKLVAGFPTVLADVDLEDFGLTVSGSDAEFGMRVELFPEVSVTRMRIYIDNVLIVNLTDGSHAQGALGFSTLGSGDVLIVREVEMFFNPMVSDVVDINS